MSAFSDFRKKLSLKKFHQKIDEFEEKLGDKLKECWASVVDAISTKFDKKPSKKIASSRNVKSAQLNKKDKKKAQSPSKKKVSKKPVTSVKSTKPMPKPIKETKASPVKLTPKSFNKASVRHVSTPQLKNMEIFHKDAELKAVENDAPKIIKSSTPPSSSNSSKRRGRPKKIEELKSIKTSPISQEVSKKSKNSKNTKKAKPK